MMTTPMMMMVIIIKITKKIMALYQGAKVSMLVIIQQLSSRRSLNNNTVFQANVQIRKKILKRIFCSFTLTVGNETSVFRRVIPERMTHKNMLLVHAEYLFLGKILYPWRTTFSDEIINPTVKPENDLGY